MEEEKKKSRMMGLSGVYEGELRYENPRWLQFLSDHIRLGFVRRVATPHVVEIEYATRFAGDFYGYLKAIGVARECFHVILELNEMRHPHEFDTHIKTILLINQDYLTEWYQRFIEVEQKTLKKEAMNPRI